MGRCSQSFHTPHFIGSVGHPVGQSLRKITGGGDSSLGDDDQRDVMNAGPLCAVRAWDAATSTMFGA